MDAQKERGRVVCEPEMLMEEGNIVLHGDCLGGERRIAFLPLLNRSVSVYCFSFPFSIMFSSSSCFILTFNHPSVTRRGHAGEARDPHFFLGS